VNIQVASVFTTNPYSVVNTSLRQTVADSASAPATSDDKVSLSPKAIALSSTQPAAEENRGKLSANASFDTDQGNKNLNIDSYFTPNPNTDFSSYSTLPPLLLPSADNINALSKHISEAMPKFLGENNIPSPPSSITYDNEGKMQLPADYQYAAQFKQALSSNPAMERELRTANALTSDFVEISKSIPFQQEYSAAKNMAEQAAVVQKYSYLFSPNRHYTSIALQFSAIGNLSFTADGQPYHI
jgi:hypothetical protein